MNPDAVQSSLTAVVDYLIDNGITLSQAEDAFRQLVIERGVLKSDGNITRASKKLGVHRNTIGAELRMHPTEKQKRKAARRAAELMANEDRRKR